MTTATLIRNEGLAWTNSGEITSAIENFKTSEEIVSALNLDYSVSKHVMKTDIDEPLAGYWAIYRDDTNKFLGHVQAYDLEPIQNVDSFKPIEPLLSDGTLSPVVADSYLNGSQVFGTFKYNETFDVLGDQYEQYFIAINDHLSPKHGITIISAPVRMVCMNMMSAVMSRSTLKTFIPFTNELATRIQYADMIHNHFTTTVKAARNRAERLCDIKIDKDGIDKLLDDLFPYIEEVEEGATKHDRANQAVSQQREAFVSCLASPNLVPFKGTAYQVLNALTDYTTHYYRSSEKAVDLHHKMTLIPGMNSAATTESLKVSKFLNNVQKFAA